MKYAMDFNLVGNPISVIRWDGENEEKFNLRSLTERLEFLERLQKGDEIYLVSGGLAEEVAKMASRKGVRVCLIAGPKLKETKKDKETFALALRRLAEEKPELFNVWLPEKADILALTITFRNWENVMEERKAVANRLRQEFYAKVLQNPNYRNFSIWDLKEEAERKIHENPHYKWIEQQEEKLEKELKEIISEMPIYKKVFQDLDGCGPLIAARLIVYIRRIDRFPSWESLASYAGFGLKNGKKQRKRKGESLGYHPQLKSAIQHLWIREQLIRWRRGDLSEELRERINKEITYKQLNPERKGTATGRAIWWMARRLIRKIYYRWRSLEVVGVSHQ